MFTFLLFALALVAPVLAVSVTEQQEILDKHNALRRGVYPSATNMLKMGWSSEAAVNAQNWANGCSLSHSPTANRAISSSGCGENLYMSAEQKTWTDAIQSWYNEVQNWQYGAGSVSGGVVGHYTQVVWYRSNQVGCAMNYCPSAAYKYFYVCHYCPPGNAQYSKPYTNGTTCAACPGACDNGLCNNPCPYSDQYSNCPDLVKQNKCTNVQVKGWCPASCQCPTEII